MRESRLVSIRRGREKRISRIFILVGADSPRISPLVWCPWQTLCTLNCWFSLFWSITTCRWRSPFERGGLRWFGLIFWFDGGLDIQNIPIYVWRRDGRSGECLLGRRRKISTPWFLWGHWDILVMVCLILFSPWPVQLNFLYLWEVLYKKCCHRYRWLLYRLG